MFSTVPHIKWKKVGFEKANEAYCFEEAHDGMAAEESFPEDEPDFMVFEGDVVVDGTAGFGAEDDEDCTLFVIDGNLTVRGTLSVAQGDFEGFLYVTGDIACDDCVVLTDAHLSVGGSLIVKNLLVTDLSDMGTLFVKKGLQAGTWADGSPRATIKLGAKPSARMLCTPGTAPRAGESFTFDPAGAGDPASVLLPAFVSDGAIDGWAIRKALLAGTPTLK